MEERNEIEMPRVGIDNLWADIDEQAYDDLVSIYPKSKRQVRRMFGLERGDFDNKRVVCVGPKIKHESTKKIDFIETKLGEFPNLSREASESADLLLFPVVLAKDTLCAVEEVDVDVLVDDIVRVLKPGGRAYISPLNQDLGSDGLKSSARLYTSLAEKCRYNGGNIDMSLKYSGRHYLTLEITKNEEKFEQPKVNVERRARDILGNAMMLAFEDDIEGNPIATTESKDRVYSAAEIENMYIAGTYNSCVVNSKRVISYVVANDPKMEVFDRVYLMTTWLASNDPRDGTNRDKTWGKHAVFLLRDRDGRWYGGSPANFDNKTFPNQDEDNPLTTYSCGELRNVLDDLQLSEGGIWAKPELFESSPYIHPPLAEDVFGTDPQLITYVGVSRKIGSESEYECSIYIDGVEQKRVTFVEETENKN